MIAKLLHMIRHNDFLPSLWISFRLKNRIAATRDRKRGHFEREYEFV